MRSVARRGVWLVAVVLAGLLAGCEVDPTQIVVVVGTDMNVPVEIDGIGTRVGPAEHEPIDERRFTLRSELASEHVPFARLPASFGVAPRDRHPERRIEIAAEARLGDDVLFETRAVTSFIERRVLRLDLFLARRCIEEHLVCAADETCTIDGCVPAAVDPGSLARWGGVDAGPPDAGRARSDAGDAGDAGDPPAPGVRLIAESDSAPLEPKLRVNDRNLYVAASIEGLTHVTEIGDFTPHPDSGSDLLIGRWDLSLEPEQVEQFGADGATVSVLAMALDESEGILVAGSYGGAPDLGVGPLQQAPRSPAGAFVARYAGASLVPSWVWTVISSGEVLVQSVAAAPAGAVAMGGRFQGTLDFGRGEEQTDDGVTYAGFVAWLAPDHNVDCHVTFSGPKSEVTNVVVEDDGRLLAAGTFEGTVDLGDGVVRAPDRGLAGAFVARYSADCVLADPVILAGIVLRAAAVPGAGAGGPVIVGSASTDVWLGKEHVSHEDPGNYDVWSMALDEGQPVGSASMASPAFDDLRDVAARSGLPVVVSGFILEDALFGAIPVPSDAADGFVAEIDDSGQPAWAEALGGPGADSVDSVCWHPTDPILYVLGRIDGDASIHETPLSPDLAMGIYVLAFTPSE